MSEGLLSKEESLYFNQCFNDSQRNGQISFDQFTYICSEYKKFDHAVLQETIKDLKTNLDKKNNNAQIMLKQEEYFNYVNTVVKDQAQSKNQNDPEMEKLFKSLAGKEGDYKLLNSEEERKYLEALSKLTEEDIDNVIDDKIINEKRKKIDLKIKFKKKKKKCN